jgi:hypothetical protein
MRNRINKYPNFILPLPHTENVRKRRKEQKNNTSNDYLKDHQPDPF